ncbi:GDP-mannose 4,6-dehydratase [Halorubrum persicum]|uniref:GDP-mannose 4,6-dehydratase n=1 Tax=Halorubrum persicum TaxID=1383844 RepID=A0A2G1WK96_9EURY|nr:NAD-dependent epimerase/dehydratase family protein [Halorubrum persicum]PHQ39383.1 GDP-mannose 4,6-dehydratase [Halorubrum persicum]
MQTALVTGAAGFIGSHLVDELLDRGWTVRGLDDLSSGDPENLKVARQSEAFTFVEGDVRNRGTVNKALGDADAVFHQAALASVPSSFEDPLSATTRNCTGTATVIDAAADCGVESVIVASSASVYGSGGTLPKSEDHPVNPESPYAASKYYTENVALQIGDREGICVSALRYFNVFGPRQDPDGEYAAVIPKFINLLLQDEQPVIFGDGEQSRDFVFVDDVVTANIQAAKESNSGVFNIARGSTVTINKLVAVINKTLDRDIEPVHEDPRPGDIRHSVADISKANKSIGFEPDTSFTEGIERTVEWFRSQ